MIKKIGGFFEAHVEKIILIIVGLLCSWLLITRVLLTPNVFEYDGRSYSPGNLDVQLLEDVRKKQKEFNSNVIELIPTNNRNYSVLFSSPLEEFDFDLNLVPEKVPDIIVDNYPRPDINKIRITNPEIEYIRSVVYEPVVEVTKKDPYEDDNSEPNDMDFVTVSGNIDVQSIVEELEKCYIDGVERELQDPCKARPIFAQVNLQRQRLLPNGQWGDWENVPRTKIDYNKNLFKYIESSSDLPLGGYDIYKFQLNRTLTQLELLQPEPYQIASAGEQWFPPELHKDYIDALRKDENQARRAGTGSNSTSTTSSRRRDRNTGIDSTTTNTGRRSSRRGGATGTNTTTTNTNQRRRGGSSTQTVDTTYGSTEDELYVQQVYDDFQSVILTIDDDITKLIDPILFWAHDDTIVPNNTYRYRIRVGILNPAPKSEDDDVIFWTSFSGVTDQVHIPGKLYFFAGEVQEAAKTVSVSVYKLHQGYWYKKVFDRVAQGEIIGGIADVEAKQEEDDESSDERMIDTKEMVTIDFTTGAIMVDVVRVSEWPDGSSSNPVPYHNMLYTFDGEEILQMPATKRPDSKIWPSDLYQAYSFVQGHINDDYEPLESWGSSVIEFEEARRGAAFINTSYR